MAAATVKLKCTGLNHNEREKKNYASFSNENAGDSAYSYLSMPVGEMKFEIGKTYSFTVETSDDDQGTGDKKKYGLP